MESSGTVEMIPKGRLPLPVRQAGAGACLPDGRLCGGGGPWYGKRPERLSAEAISAVFIFIRRLHLIAAMADRSSVAQFRPFTRKVRQPVNEVQ